MTVLRESATNRHAEKSAAAERFLVCAPNWLGDTLMAMPAIRACYRRHRPAPEITVLCKPALLDLWRLFREPVRVIPLESGCAGVLRTANRLRSAAFQRAMILPNSFRSAWLPYLAGIPVRRGFPGHQRRWLLTERVARPAGADGTPVHQQCEYAAVTGIPWSRAQQQAENAEPVLWIPPNARMAAVEHWGGRLTGSVIMLFPGAARGPSKRWPSGLFAELGRRWLRETGGTVLIAGTSAEHGLCKDIACGIGAKAVNLAGKTPLPELAALVDQAAVVVGNDSGGTHLAAALATPVVSIFGQTNPAVTAPAGKHTRVIAAAAPRADRRIAREAPAARALLASISVDTVLETALAVVNEAHQS